MSGVRSVDLARAIGALPPRLASEATINRRISSISKHFSATFVKTAVNCAPA